MNEIVNIIANQGVAIAMVVYFIWYNNNTMKEVSQSLSDLTLAINKLMAIVDKDGGDN